MTSRERTRGRVLAIAEHGLLVVLAYLPFLLSSPGRIASDSKQALYVDPGAFLGDAARLWDPSVAAGTVTHQHVGYLWPMGPWFWFADVVGIPTWIAQRVWLGTLTLLALLGARWLIRSLGLGRVAALMGAIVYAGTPYQLAFTARTSILLLPWVGLPWLVELTRRAVLRGGWRHPALFALVAGTVAGVNAPTLVLVGLAPLVVLVDAAVRGRWRDALGVGFRIGALSVLTGLWWFAALIVQARQGLDVLAVTEDLRATSSRSSPDDLLRGLGNWFFYGGDRRGPHIVQSVAYEGWSFTAMATFLLPAVALFTAAVVRWRGRLIAIAFVMATVLAVGPWPYDRPSPVGRLFRTLGESSAVGMAFRNSARIVPVVVLGLALVLAAAIAAVPTRFRTVAAGFTALLVLATALPLLRHGLLSEPVERQANIPSYWLDAAERLDRAGSDTRVLELPGANFAAYRWGNAIEPITPLLIDRPYLAREVLPYGSPESALLLDALDRRLQNGVLDAASIAPVARLLGVGDIVVRADLDQERFGLRSPSHTWSLLTDPPVAGLGEPESFGEPTPDPPGGHLDPFLPSDLRGSASKRDTPLSPVTILPVEDPQSIVRIADPDDAVILDGDADGIVDAAGAGVIDGRSPLLLSPGLDDTELAREASRAQRLVVTDSNRRRSQTWFTSIRDTRGPTERAGETLPEPSGHDARFETFPDGTDDSRSVTEQIGAEVEASTIPGVARPEDRAVAAFDGRPETSWRVGGPDPAGTALSIRTPEPVALDDVVLLQPQDGPRDRWIDRVLITVDGAESVEVTLDERSLDPPGQPVDLPVATGHRVDIEILGTTTPPMPPEFANAVGFAEVRLGDLTVDETVRVPRDLLQRLGSSALDLPLDIILTRLRIGSDSWTRGDEEPVLDRRIDLPTARSFEVTGVVSPADRASDIELDHLLGTGGSTVVEASSRLQGAPEMRASRVLDGDPSTRWTTAFGAGEPAWLRITAEEPSRIEEIEIDVIADDRHSVPSRITVRTDDRVIGRGIVDPASAEGSEDRVVTVPVDFDEAVETDDLRIEFDERHPVADTAPDEGGSPLPIAVTEVRGTGFDLVPTNGDLDRNCREDLLDVDGRPVPVRLQTGRADGTFTVTSCEDLDLDPGVNRVTSFDRAPLQVDQVVLRSASGGEAGDGPIESPRRRVATPTAVDSHRTRVSATVRSDGDEFWFVLGQSRNDGWEISVTGGTAGPATLVDGFSDGWLISPDGPGEVAITVTWTPQRFVWAGLIASLLGALLCLAIVQRTGRAAVPLLRVDPRPVPPTERRGVDLHRAVRVAALIGVAAALSSRWWIGVVAGVAALVVALRPAAVWSVGIAAAGSLLAARALLRPELGWLALALTVAAALTDEIGRRLRSGERFGVTDPDP